MNRFCLAFATLISASFASADTTEDGEEKAVGQEFTEAKVVERSTPNFPSRELRNQHEGWAIVNYMVDAKGRPYDLVVSESSGHPRFEEEAIKALEKSVYEPATLDGNPIDTGLRSVVTFELAGSTGARRDFRSRFRAVQKAIKNGEQKRAEKLFEKMWNGKRNLYETAYYHLAKYQFELTWGTPTTQYRELHLATFNNRTQEFLPDDVLINVLRQKIKLQLDRNRLAAALETVERLLPRLTDENAKDIVNRLVVEINKSIESDQQIVVPVNFHEGTRFAHRLVRPSFTLNSLFGELAELRVHCRKGLLIFKPEVDMRYRIREGWNDCTLIMVGNPQTTLNLIEDHL